MNHGPIDRKALVTRHNIRPADITRVIPLGMAYLPRSRGRGHFRLD